MEFTNSNKNIYSEISVTPDEYCRITYELTEDDFSTIYPNPVRIDKMAIGMEKYLAYKKNHIRCYK